MKNLVFSILCIAFLMGCGEQQVALSESQDPVAITHINGLYPSWVKAEHAADIETRFEISNPVRLSFFDAVQQHGRADWKALDAVARLQRQQVNPEYRYMVDQFLGREMLRSIDEGCTAQCNEARAYYVNLLVEAGHPDAAAMEHYLAQLKGHLSPDDLHEARLQSAANAEVWLKRQQQTAGKRDCGPGINCDVIADAQDEATRNIAEATSRLQGN